MGEIDEKTILLKDKDWQSLNSDYYPKDTKKQIRFLTDEDDDMQRQDIGDLESLTLENSEKSWWFHFCKKLRDKEAGAGWEPTYWQSICPYPFCPTYRHFARVLSLLLLILLGWGAVYSIIGNDAAPGGQLFDIALLCFASHFGGWIFRLINLPGPIGMLLVGIVFQNIGLVNVHRNYVYFTSVLRKIALVIILTRAGLDMNSEDMKRLCCTVLRLGLVPWLVECSIAAVFAHYLLRVPWTWAILLGSCIGAVSPAIVVPILIRLRVRGYGVAKGIPTLVIAVAGIDDATSVAAFGIILCIMSSEHSLTYNLLLGPVTVLSGVGYGILWGLLSKTVPEEEDTFVVALRVLLTLCGGMAALFGSERLGIGGAGPLAVLTAAFGSSWAWQMHGWTIANNTIASIFAIFWVVFEPILFSLTGTQIIMSTFERDILTITILGILVGVLIRILVTVAVGFGANLNFKEKLCCGFFWMNKASVQAALGAIVVDYARTHDTTREEKHYANVTLMYCVMSVLLTAPIGSTIISLFGSRLLTKTGPGPAKYRQSSNYLSFQYISVAHEED